MSKPHQILTLLQQSNTQKTLQILHAHIFTNGYLTIPSISNRLIKAFSQSQDPLQAIQHYNHMVRTSSYCHPNSMTFTFLLKSCEKIKAENKCKEVHGSIIRYGCESDVVVSTNLIRSYAVIGSFQELRRVFDEMPHRDLVAWNSMISCYCQMGLHQEALRLYGQMRVLNVGFDGFTVVNLLSACSHVGALNIGVKLHKLAGEKRLLDSLFVGNALIDMYGKCGSLDGAVFVFNGMEKKDVFTWNSMIVGYGVNGFGDEAILIFEKMLMNGVKPDGVTFLGLLCSCSHQGLVDKGVEYFHLMSSEFGLKPEVKHYGCMVDLFGRAGKLRKAIEVIEGSPFCDDPILWRTLLGSCKIHKDVERGEIAMKKLAQVGAPNAGDCILLADIYERANDLHGVARMRKLIKNGGIKTTPGWSWIEVGDEMHRFVVDDKSHPDSEEIYCKLKKVISKAKFVGYTEDSMVDVLESESDRCLANFGSFHSEKLAIAFGLARTSEGTTLRIVKNLRVCRDCHSFTKFVSRAYNREIIVRDRVRFHHFKDGVCSCKDYW